MIALLTHTLPGRPCHANRNHASPPLSVASDVQLKIVHRRAGRAAMRRRRKGYRARDAVHDRAIRLRAGRALRGQLTAPQTGSDNRARCWRTFTRGGFAAAAKTASSAPTERFQVVVGLDVSIAGRCALPRPVQMRRRGWRIQPGEPNSTARSPLFWFGGRHSAVDQEVREPIRRARTPRLVNRHPDQKPQTVSMILAPPIIASVGTSLTSAIPLLHSVHEKIRPNTIRMRA